MDNDLIYDIETDEDENIKRRLLFYGELAKKSEEAKAKEHEMEG